MAANAPLFTRAQPAFDMRSLWHVGGWGVAASMALLLAVFAGSSETGSRRLLAALKPPIAETQSTGVASHGIDTQPAYSAAALRALSSEREGLNARLSMIERQLDDLTGSIRMHEVRPSPPVPLSPPAASPAASAAPATWPEREVASARLEPSPAAPSAAGAEHAPPAEEPKTLFGADLGGAPSFDGLRQLWTAAKSSNAAQFDGLSPLVGVNEGGRGRSPELRLIVGPFSDAEVALRWCTTLAAASRFCQLSSFEGQRLTDAERVIERKPPLKAAPRPAPRLFGLF